MTSWVPYTGSDEQIAELQTSKFIYRYKTKSAQLRESSIENMLWRAQINQLSHYWIIPDDPLRDMKIRQAMTGQPVWIRTEDWTIDVNQCGGQLIGNSTDTHMVFITTTPDWNMPNAEYSFSPFEDKS